MTVRATAAPGPKPSGPRTRAKQSAAALPTRCPSTSARGRAAGASGVQKRMTASAPSGGQSTVTAPGRCGSARLERIARAEKPIMTPAPAETASATAFLCATLEARACSPPRTADVCAVRCFAVRGAARSAAAAAKTASNRATSINDFGRSWIQVGIGSWEQVGIRVVS